MVYTLKYDKILFGDFEGSQLTGFNIILLTVKGFFMPQVQNWGFVDKNS